MVDARQVPHLAVAVAVAVSQTHSFYLLNINIVTIQMSAFIDYSKFVPKDSNIAWEPIPWQDPWVKMVKSLGTTPGATKQAVLQKTPENHVALRKTEVVATEAEKAAFVDSMGSLVGDTEEAPAEAVAGKKKGRPKGSKESEETKNLKAKAKDLAKIIRAQEHPTSPANTAVQKRRAAIEAKKEAQHAAQKAESSAVKRKAVREAVVGAHLGPGQNPAWQTASSGHDSGDTDKKKSKGKRSSKKGKKGVAFAVGGGGPERTGPGYVPSGNAIPRTPAKGKRRGGAVAVTLDLDDD